MTEKRFFSQADLKFTASTSLGCAHGIAIAEPYPLPFLQRALLTTQRIAIAQCELKFAMAEQAKESKPVVEFTVASSGEDLRYAARTGDLDEATEILNRYKGDSNELARFLPAVLAAADSQSGNKALHLCAANGHLDVLRFLIEQGSDVDAINQSGSTPLHYASLTGQLDIVKELIKNNAKPVVMNKYEKTALDEARSTKKNAVAAFLMSHVEETNEAPDLDDEADDNVDEQVAKLSSDNDANKDMA